MTGVANAHGKNEHQHHELEHKKDAVVCTEWFCISFLFACFVPTTPQDFIYFLRIKCFVIELYWIQI